MDTTADRTFAELRPLWDAWVLQYEEQSILDFLDAVEEGTADHRVYFRGYYHGVRFRLGLPTISALQHALVDQARRDNERTVMEELIARGLADAFSSAFFNGAIDAIAADAPPH